MQKKIGFSVVSLLALGTAMSTPANATETVYAYLSAPNQQYAPTTISGTTSVTFDSGITTGNHTSYISAIGTYSGNFDVHATDQYGNGTGNYFALGAESGSSAPVTLTFSSGITYFGLSYDAGDPFNGFTFYDTSGSEIGRYSTATLTAALSGSTVTALNGTVYQTQGYYGQPDGTGTVRTTKGSQDSSEPFSFVNFFAATGTTIGSIVFDNSGSLSTGFESDNHTISTSQVGPPTSGNYIGVGTSTSVAPDASSLALLIGAMPIASMIVRRRRK